MVTPLTNSVTKCDRFITTNVTRNTNCCYTSVIEFKLSNAPTPGASHPSYIGFLGSSAFPYQFIYFLHPFSYSSSLVTILSTIPRLAAAFFHPSILFSVKEYVSTSHFLLVQRPTSTVTIFSYPSLV